MQKLTILNAILQNPIVGIIRAPDADAALQLADACITGGITVLEVSLTTPDGLDVIRSLVKRYGNDAMIGAGTVLDAATARLSILAGSRFILSPSFDVEVIQTCNRYQVVSMPGVATATEVVKAMESGADIVKVFPGDAFGPAYLKALRAPLPHAPLMPSGGVTLENMDAWFACGAVAVGVGGSLTAPGASGDYEKVTENAKAFVRALSQIRARSNTST
ncbi:bifunctional 2-keto-4-hydroxyglutarate aldolase/2-keto-3-deoxy-6-phosphogluconate aldolase [Noviherbaspirillum sp.]|jgi:2-dehydro-3-deoxyphosphogluconate aldolase/(4S)-4-hydroxy-2-oxoglutarate aldolase|uniref:bifunctional 2-keto-4-hydroxyglutarate aldolase/2-keto-3-deoxy-6-phosphogluconate aldolase n=1 Tax=Noviherbaspirillum sp. TaxID=1926288 RepID=UPI0025D944A2|nr:bifunctional 2-keto-4-hydroxyglutarate aldolase/2-keto-3-deoxy-6-phosphogluconate aldolase [Noviherbaspirillum sp.]